MLVRETSDVYRATGVHSDHFFVIEKLALPKRLRTTILQKQEKEETFKGILLKEEDILNIKGKTK
jgi:hypothetical protein